MKTQKLRYKYFDTIDQYYKFCNKEGIKVINVIYTHNYKFKVTYVIIKQERSTIKNGRNG